MTPATRAPAWLLGLACLGLACRAAPLPPPTDPVAAARGLLEALAAGDCARFYPFAPPGTVPGPQEFQAHCAPSFAGPRGQEKVADLSSYSFDFTPESVTAREAWVRVSARGLDPRAASRFHLVLLDGGWRAPDFFGPPPQPGAPEPGQDSGGPAGRLDAGPVTVADFARCASAGACQAALFVPHSTRPACRFDSPQAAGLPMNCVSYWGAQAYCQWAGAHLATNREWEAALRGGLAAPDGGWQEWMLSGAAMDAPLQGGPGPEDSPQAWHRLGQPYRLSTVGFRCAR